MIIFPIILIIIILAEMYIMQIILSRYTANENDKPITKRLKKNKFVKLNNHGRRKQKSGL